ncbi:ABC transporter substrate-binding protein [Bogoriella caseilytica]|uniref:Carbohydrate ABC transporter substrate-binding protein (CUT1 family) n=1 Tax=Bogoriella caseilytica TaxID=56055 RepID=A0A3N2BGC8_9MICO|nr:ABC transporter substrate-binding protein [Bogoriella caseilytica]ROR74309.1 carbohydrate ABC transporter substrate-binding protein (CUT1 family) [Bogoriella caseilytica]
MPVTTMRSPRRRATAAVAVAALGASGLAACTPDGGGGDEMVWAIGGAEAQTGGAFQQIAELWNEENPDRPVTVETLPESADEQREQLALELDAGGSGFDILGVDVIWTGEFQENGWVESLEGVRGDIEGLVLDGPIESAEWGGELWAVPINTNGGYLVYRTDVTEEAPTTWDELCEIATDNEVGGYIAQGAQYEGLVVNWLEYFWGNGGELFNDDQSEVTFDVDLAAETLEWMAEAYESGCFNSGFNSAMEEEARIAFSQGNAAFQRNWPYVYDLTQSDSDDEVAENFDIAPLPTFDGQGTVTALGGFNNAVSAFSNHTDDATDFVVWAATSEEAQALLGAPVLSSAYEDADSPSTQLLGEILEDSRPRPPSPAWAEISIEMSRQIFEAYNGQTDPQTAAQNIHDFLESTL